MGPKVRYGSELLTLVLVLAMFASHTAMGTITCQQAVPLLLPCQSFLTGHSPTVSPSCCQGVDTVNKRADTTACRKDLCTCFKNAAKAIGVIPEKAKALPKQCGITPRVPIDPNQDCNRISFMEMSREGVQDHKLD